MATSPTIPSPATSEAPPTTADLLGQANWYDMKVAEYRSRRSLASQQDRHQFDAGITSYTAKAEALRKQAVEA